MDRDHIDQFLDLIRDMVEPCFGQDQRQVYDQFDQDQSQVYDQFDQDPLARDTMGSEQWEIPEIREVNSPVCLVPKTLIGQIKHMLRHNQAHDLAVLISKYNPISAQTAYQILDGDWEWYQSTPIQVFYIGVKPGEPNHLLASALH